MPAPACRRIAALLLLLAVPAAIFAQNTPASPAAPGPDRRVITLLHDSQQYNNPLTIIETDGTHIRGVVIAIDADSIQLSVAYGQPVTRIALAQIAGLDNPPKSHHQKVTLGILVVVAVALIGALIAMVIKFHSPPA